MVDSTDKIRELESQLAATDDPQRKIDFMNALASNYGILIFRER